jgi:hypothetical protein
VILNNGLEGQLDIMSVVEEGRKDQAITVIPLGQGVLDQNVAGPLVAFQQSIVALVWPLRQKRVTSRRKQSITGLRPTLREAAKHIVAVGAIITHVIAPTV